jgi:hypothetical protein
VGETFLIRKYFDIISAPFKWWLRKDKVNPQVNYAVSLYSIANDKDWIVACSVLIVFECNVTKNVATKKFRVVLSEDDVIFNASRVEIDESVKQAFINQATKNIDFPKLIAEARQTINTQVLIEAAIVSLGTAIVASLAVWIANLWLLN